MERYRTLDNNPTWHWSDDSYDYPDRSSSVAFHESTSRYTLGSKVKIGVAWAFFAMMSFAYAIVPIFSLVALPALLGCVGIITQAYATAEERRFEQHRAPPRARPNLERALRPTVGRVL